jgi:hypothetical protein
MFYISTSLEFFPSGSLDTNREYNLERKTSSKTLLLTGSTDIVRHIFISVLLLRLKT